MFRQSAPVMLNEYLHHTGRTMQRAMLVLLLGLFGAACLSAPAQPSTSLSIISYGGADGGSSGPAGVLASSSHTTGRSLGAASGIGGDYPDRVAYPASWFENDHTSRRMLSQIAQPAATLLIVGDMMLGRQVGIEMLERDDFAWPFRRTAAGLLASVDLTLGNLETPLVSGCPYTSDGMVFCAVPRSAEGLAWAGIDGVSLANNHALTYGEAGLAETIERLRQAGVEPIPAGTMAVRDINGMQIGILTFDDSNALLDLEQAAATTRESARQVDVLIGLLHWGVEYHIEPSLRQQEVGHALADAGMDVIVGTHPHVRQPVETYNGNLIVYSLGNFVFDQMWWEETRLGEVIRLNLVKTSSDVTVSYELIPVEIFDYGQPVVIGQGR